MTPCDSGSDIDLPKWHSDDGDDISRVEVATTSVPSSPDGTSGKMNARRSASKYRSHPYAAASVAAALHNRPVKRSEQIHIRSRDATTGIHHTFTSSSRARKAHETLLKVTNPSPSSAAAAGAASNVDRQHPCFETTPRAYLRRLDVSADETSSLVVATADDTTFADGEYDEVPVPVPVPVVFDFEPLQLRKVLLGGSPSVIFRDGNVELVDRTIRPVVLSYAASNRFTDAKSRHQKRQQRIVRRMKRHRDRVTVPVPVPVAAAASAVATESAVAASVAASASAASVQIGSGGGLQIEPFAAVSPAQVFRSELIANQDSKGASGYRRLNPLRSIDADADDPRDPHGLTQTGSSSSLSAPSSGVDVSSSERSIVNNVPIMIVCDSIAVTEHQSGTVLRIESTSLNSNILITLPDPLVRPGMQFTFILSKPRLGQLVSIISDGLNGYPFEWSTMVDKNPVTFSLQPKIINSFDRLEPNTFHTTPVTLISGRDICGRGIWFSNNLTFGWLPMNDHSQKYASIKHEMQDLDLIVFRGNAFASRVITAMERLVSGKGEWSHVGLVVSKRLLPDLKTNDPPDTLYIWESTLSTGLVSFDPARPAVPGNSSSSERPTGAVCAESNQPVFGVQIRRLDDVLKHCFAQRIKVGWCKLIVNPQRKRLDETPDGYEIRLNNMKRMAKILHDDYYHRPYERNLFRVFSSLSKFLNCCRSDCCPGRSWVFCSQLVGIVYQQLGLIDQQIDPASITPQLLVSPETSKHVHIMRVVAPPIILV